MKKLCFLTIAFILISIVSNGQTITNKQAHALLSKIVLDGKSHLDGAEAQIINQVATGNGGTIVSISLSSDNSQETYVASCDAKGQFIDGMIVATKGDIRVLRSQRDNEYIWFVPKGEANLFISSDSLIVVRNYNYEMKPLGETHMRHWITVTSRYVIMSDGKFEQSEPLCEASQIEYELDEAGNELPAKSQKRVSPDFNELSLKVMQLLYAPVSASDKTMEEWAELGEFFERRSNMMGVPDADLWSAYYYKENIHRLLLQGEGHNMEWFYRHHDEGQADCIWQIMILGYNHAGTSFDNKTASWIFKELNKSAKRLKDKNARDWWKNFIK